MSRLSPRQEALRQELLGEIHADMDAKLVEALGRWCDSQDISIAKLTSSLAYFLSETIYTSTPTEDQACLMIQSYNDYTHNVVHRMWAEREK